MLNDKLWRATAAFGLVIALASLAVAETTSDGHGHTGEAGGRPHFEVTAAARDAVAAVDRFSAALSAGDLAGAAAELDPAVLILEGGSAESSAAEYLGGHARADAAFLQTAKRQLIRRTAHASGDFVWVASESEFQVREDGEPMTVFSTETMVLRHGDSGWRIVHIHWSSRTKDQSASH